MSEQSQVSPSRKDRKRAEIVAVAQDLFFRDGYAATSMSQIAVAVGGSKATLYNHFQSKDELLRAVVQEVMEMRPEDYGAGAEPAQFQAWLAWFGRATAKKITSYSYIALQRLAAAEAQRFPEIGLMIEAGVMRNFPEIEKRFADAMQAGILRRGDPHVASEHFVEMCLGWMLRRLLWNIKPAAEDEEIDRYVDNAVAAFLHGYAAH